MVRVVPYELLSTTDCSLVVNFTAVMYIRDGRTEMDGLNPL